MNWVMEKLATSASLMGQKKGSIFCFSFYLWTGCTMLFQVFIYCFPPCRKRKPRKNTTKYGPNAKIPTKRTKKQSEQEVQDAQVEQSKEAVQDEQAEQSAIVPFAPEMSLVETSSTNLTMETYVQPTDEPSRTTRRTPIKKKTTPKKLIPRKTKTS